MEKILEVTVSLLLLVFYFIYLRQVIQKKSTPNSATWIIWSVIVVINTTIHFSGVCHTVYQTLIVFAGFSGIFLIMFHSIFECKFPKLVLIDKIILIVSLVTVVFWLLTKNADLSNIFLQTAIFLSFIPTIVGLIKNRLEEAKTAWVIATIAYAIQTTSLILNYDYSTCSFPLLVLINLLGNGLIVAVIVNKKYKK